MTRRLWARHGIETRLISYHAQSSDRREAGAAGASAGGEDVALVTDAGTPLVSDPGGELVAPGRGAGGRVVPIPGASAVLAALVASGLPAAALGVRGVPAPARPGAPGADRAHRRGRPRHASCSSRPAATAATLATWPRPVAANAAAALCRELTKLHEEIRRGSLAELAAARRRRPAAG